MYKSPLKPLAEEVPLDPTIAVLGIFEKIQIVHLEYCLACLTVSVSSYGVEVCHVLFHILFRLANLEILSEM